MVRVASVSLFYGPMGVFCAARRNQPDFVAVSPGQSGAGVRDWIAATTLGAGGGVVYVT